MTRHEYSTAESTATGHIIQDSNWKSSLGLRTIEQKIHYNLLVNARLRGLNFFKVLSLN